MEKVDLTEFWKNPKKSLVILFYKGKEIDRSEVVEHKFSENIEAIRESCMITDTVTFELKRPVFADRVQLYYEDELISYRRFPTIQMSDQDLLTVEFSLFIEVTNNQFLIKLF